MFGRLRRSRAISGSAIYLLSNILNAIIPFAMMPILTRYLAPAEYGEVAMFQTLVTVFSAIAGLNAVGSAGRKYYDGGLAKDDLADFMGVCTQILLVSSLFLLGAMAIFADGLGAWIGVAGKWVLVAVPVSAALVFAQIRLGQWQVRKEARRYGAFQVSRSILNMLLSILLVVLLHKGADGRIVAQVWTAGVFALFAVASLKRERLLNLFVWRPAYLKEALRFGVPLIPHSLGLLLLASVDRFVITDQLGLASVGIYMVAVQVAAAIGLVLDAVNKAYVPWLYERLKRDREDEKLQIVRYTYAWYGIVVLAVALAFLLGPWVIKVVAAPKYAEAGQVIGWLALGQALGGLYTFVAAYSHYAKRTGILSVVTIVTGAGNIALLFLLIPRWGLEGAAIAYCAAMGARFLLTWWVAQHHYPMPWLHFQRGGSDQE